MLAPAAASSLDKHDAIAAQNLLSSSRPATGGRPGEGNGALPERSERRRFHLVIVTPHEAWRRPLESAQYVSIKYTERLVQVGVEPSVGSVGDSDDNALAETINGLYKGEIT